MGGGDGEFSRICVWVRVRVRVCVRSLGKCDWMRVRVRSLGKCVWLRVRVRSLRICEGEGEGEFSRKMCV